MTTHSVAVDPRLTEVEKRKLGNARSTDPRRSHAIPPRAISGDLIRATEHTVQHWGIPRAGSTLRKEACVLLPFPHKTLSNTRVHTHLNTHAAWRERAHTSHARVFVVFFFFFFLCRARTKMLGEKSSQRTRCRIDLYQLGNKEVRGECGTNSLWTSMYRVYSEVLRLSSVLRFDASRK